MFENISNLSPETIIFGGLTLVSLSLVILVWRISARYGNHSTDIMNKNAEAWIQNAKAQQRHSDTLEHFGVLIKASHDVIARSVRELSKIIKKQSKK